MVVARFLELSDMHVQDREDWMRRMFDNELVPYRNPKEKVWIEIYRYFRALNEPDGPFAAKMRHPYPFAAIMSIHSSILPIFLSAEPPFQIVDPNPENRERNQVAEEIITAQIRQPQRSNFREAFDDILLTANVFGCAFPWLSWRSQTQQCGPFHEPVVDYDGRPLRDADGSPVLAERYKKLRVYHGWWLEHVDVLDTYMHPDGRRGFTIRDVTGRDLLAMSQGANPVYSPVLVDRMLKMEINAVVRARDPRGGGGIEGGFSMGNQAIQDRDAFARESGFMTKTDFANSSLMIAEDVLNRTFPILHFDDGYNIGAYALSQSGRFMELRFRTGCSPDGQGCRIPLRISKSPSDVYGVGLLEEALPLLKSLSRFFQAAMDGAALTVNPVWLASTKFRETNGGLVLGPGALLDVPASGGEPLENHLRRLDMPQTWVSAMQFTDKIVTSLDTLFGSGPFTRGQAAGGRTTAFEMSSLTQFTSGRLKLTHERVVTQFGLPLLRKVMCLNTIHMTPGDYRKVLGIRADRYIPPQIEEIVENLAVVPKGSLESSDAMLRAGRWAQVLSTMLRALPALRYRPVNEAFKAWLQDMGMEAISRVMPVADDSIETEYAAMQASRGGGGTQAAPGGLTDAMRQAGGMTAPPGPFGEGGTSEAVEAA